MLGIKKEILLLLPPLIIPELIGLSPLQEVQLPILLTLEVIGLVLRLISTLQKEIGQLRLLLQEVNGQLQLLPIQGVNGPSLKEVTGLHHLHLLLEANGLAVSIVNPLLKEVPGLAQHPILLLLQEMTGLALFDHMIHLYHLLIPQEIQIGTPKVNGEHQSNLPPYQPAGILNLEANCPQDQKLPKLGHNLGWPLPLIPLLLHPVVGIVDLNR